MKTKAAKSVIVMTSFSNNSSQSSAAQQRRSADTREKARRNVSGSQPRRMLCTRLADVTLHTLMAAPRDSA